MEGSDGPGGDSGVPGGGSGGPGGDSGGPEGLIRSALGALGAPYKNLIRTVGRSDRTYPIGRGTYMPHPLGRESYHLGSHFGTIWG